MPGKPLLPQNGCAVEYRVRWRREGHGHSYRIYQTKQAAERKVRGILALEAVKVDTKMADMPDLVERPIIQQRPVGEWDDSGLKPEPTDKDREGMADYFGRPEDDGYGPF